MSMDNVIGRKHEKERLDDCMEREEAQLIALYGRRRVGKTFLITQYFNGRFDFKLTGIYDQPLAMQLKNFAFEMANQTGENPDVPKDWMEAFFQLRKYIENKPETEKTIVFFDELPWMDTPRSDFLSSFEWFWNSFGSMRKNLVFIVAGSAASWMRINLDENKGGLYNRLTCRIYLKPFTLGETEKYLLSRQIEWTRYDILRCYMILGGIPYYLSLLSPEMSPDQNIDNLFFRKRAELWDEFSFLYRTLFKRPETSVRIAETLSRKRSGMTRNELVCAADIPDNGETTNILNNMEYSGFLRINNQYGSQVKKYQLSDYYSLFYFRFIRKNYGKDEHFWSNMLDNPARRSWEGLTFEQICLDHVPQIKKKLGISGVLSETSVWSTRGSDAGSGAQIDLIIKRRDHVTNLCEIKFSSGMYVIDKNVDINLRNKIDAFQREAHPKETLQLTFVTTYGLKKNRYSSIVQNEVTMDDLFENV